MVARDGVVLQRAAHLDVHSLREGLEHAITNQSALDHARARRRRRRPVEDYRVRSVQRLPLPKGRDAAWVASEYARWLPTHMRLIRVEVDEDRTCRFYVWPLRAPVLVLTFAPSRSGNDRQLYYVTGGSLARVTKGERPRLEFRTASTTRFFSSRFMNSPRVCRGSSTR